MAITRQWKRFLPWPDVDLPPAILFEFGYDTFSLAEFGQHNIAMPESLKRAVSKRQAEYLYGRVAAAQALAILDVPPADIGSGPAREPLWPPGVIGSITHTHRFAAAIAVASSQCTGIGMDIEHLVTPDAAQSIESTVLNTSERALLDGWGSTLPYNTLLTVAFSAKESFYKATFATVGSYFDFHAVTLTALNPSAGTLELTVDRTLAPAIPKDRRFVAAFEFIDEDAVLTSVLWQA
ncbi:4'-phosphopantetheinyl transferase EntD [Luteibacter sp. Sphag1AF]|uniref:4'-phosphopantetheinyl transferase superfamily protein n=1 Tax=Luteibacter sp. Sphag1AF TaxID=2587031 RepID=UPI00161E3129|nr:4'-phosphopantetheinyl transferase EntD [Luteibacter sp. Sphag1AF]